MKQKRSLSEFSRPSEFTRLYHNFTSFAGQTDDWKNYYTVKENEDMVDLIHSKLKGTDLKLQSSL